MSLEPCALNAEFPCFPDTTERGDGRWKQAQRECEDKVTFQITLYCKKCFTRIWSFFTHHFLILLRVLLILTKMVLVLAYYLCLFCLKNNKEKKCILYNKGVHWWPMGKNIVGEHNYVQEHISIGTMFSTSQSVSVLDHDLWVCPPHMIKLITLPFLRLFAWMAWMGVQTTKHSGSVQNLTEKKQCWLCSKPFLKSFTSSATLETSLQGGRECVNSTQTHRGGDRLQRRVHTTYLLLGYYYCKFSGSE